MKAYELILLVDPDLPEDRRIEVVSTARSLLESKSSKITTDESWGMRKLAYEIDHRTDALYHKFEFDGPSNSIEELSRNLRIADGVLRFRVLSKVERKKKAVPTKVVEPATTVSQQ